MVQNVPSLKSVNWLWTDNSSNSFNAFGVASCLLERLTGYSFSPSVQYSMALLLAVYSVLSAQKGLMGLPRAGHKQRDLLAIYHLSSPLLPIQPPRLLPSPDSSYFKKDFMHLFICKLQSTYTFQMKWLGLWHFLKYTFYYFLVFAMKVSFKLWRYTAFTNLLS